MKNLIILAVAVLTFLTLVGPAVGQRTDSLKNAIYNNDAETLANDRLLPKYNDNLATITAPNKIINNLKALRSKGLAFRAAGDGRLKYISADTKPIVLSRQVAGEEKIALQFLKDYGRYFGLNNANTQVIKDKIETRGGRTHLRYQHVYKGIPVWGSSFLIHLDKTGVTSATGNVLGGFTLNTTPKFNKKQIKAIAGKIGKQQFAMTAPGSEEPKLYVYNKKYLNDNEPDKNYLAYEIAVDDKDNGAKKQILIIDAKTGRLISSFAGVEFSLDRQVYNCHSTKSDCRYKKIGKSENKKNSTILFPNLL